MCPPNGGYAPARRLESPRNGGLIKPGLISSDSSRSPNEDNNETNAGKRRLDDTNLVNGSQAKRPKTEASLLADRRKDVQSTSELVAKLSENLPQHMAVDFNAKIAMDLNIDEVPITPTTIKKTKRKDQQAQQPEMIQKPPSEEVVDKTELVHRFLDSSVPVIVVPDQPEQVAPRNWYDVLPGLNELSDQMADCSHPARLCSSDDSLRQGVVLQGLGRENRDVFVLPYLDVGMPDFVEFSLPDSQQFIAGPRL